MTENQMYKYSRMLGELEGFNRFIQKRGTITYPNGAWSVFVTGYKDGGRGPDYLNEHPEQVLRVLAEDLPAIIDKLKQAWDTTMELRKELANEKRNK